MEITKIINTCKDCRYISHSGAFTKGGAKDICDHPLACKYATEKKTLQRNNDMYHWIYRVIKKADKIPGWCPLKHNGEY